MKGLKGLKVVKLFDSGDDDRTFVVSNTRIQYLAPCEVRDRYGGFDTGLCHECSGEPDGCQEYKCMVSKALVYWDGHNWQTRVLEDLYGTPDGEEIEGDEAKSILIAYLNVHQWKRTGHGYTEGKSGGYVFTDSQWEGSFGIEVTKE